MTGRQPEGLVVWARFAPLLAEFEVVQGLMRGAPGSERAAMIFATYFPNPAILGTDAAAHALVPPLLAATVEGAGTAILVFVAFALTDRRTGRGPTLPPILIRR